MQPVQPVQPVQDVVIVGAGGFGREVHEWLDDCNEHRPALRLLGFLDDDPARHGTTCHGSPILGGLDWLAGHARTVAPILGVGSPPAKRRIVARLRALGVTEFPSLVHPTAVIGRTVQIGEGAVICPGVIVTTDVRIGSFVTLNLDLTIGHDSVVGDYVTIAPGVHVSGHAELGEGCDLGTGAALIPSAKVGSWSVIGAGAVVTGTIPSDCTAVGVPARPIKTRPPGWHSGEA
ncbi:MAG TPA: acetyltransferase [Kofleriaceae bacterium]|nr:acetyltransferase [Kofleriaceae bacterium]